MELIMLIVVIVALGCTVCLLGYLHPNKFISEEEINNIDKWYCGVGKNQIEEEFPLFEISREEYLLDMIEENQFLSEEEEAYLRNELYDLQNKVDGWKVKVLYLLAKAGLALAIGVAVICRPIARLQKQKRIRKEEELKERGIITCESEYGIFEGLEKLRLPMTWLLHFLKGTEKNLKVPEEVVLEAEDAIVRGILGEKYDERREGSSWCNKDLEGRHQVYHSTLYEGSGFYDRPTLFYLVGGFTFQSKVEGDFYIDWDGEIIKYNYGGCLKIDGLDMYDWHPTKSEGGDYFTSPMAEWMIKPLNKIFGENLFPMNGFPSGETGISNQLWEEFYRAGAGDFISVIEAEIK